MNEDAKKPFYKEKEFWIEVAKIAIKAGVTVGLAYLTQKQGRK